MGWLKNISGDPIGAYGTELIEPSAYHLFGHHQAASLLQNNPGKWQAHTRHRYDVDTNEGKACTCGKLKDVGAPDG